MRTHNIHIDEAENPEVERHIAFAAYLRAHDSIRDEYAALKRYVYERHPADITAYNDGKDAWIKRVQVEAVGWFRPIDPRRCGPFTNNDQFRNRVQDDVEHEGESIRLGTT